MSVSQSMIVIVWVQVCEYESQCDSESMSSSLSAYVSMREYCEYVRVNASMIVWVQDFWFKCKSMWVWVWEGEC